MFQRRETGALKLSRRKLLVVIVAFSVLTTAHQCEDENGNPIAHDHCWDGSEALPGGCPAKPTPSPEPPKEIAVTDCTQYPAIVHGEPHQTFPFDSNGNGIKETCAYPGQIPHTHEIELVSHTHTYYPYDREGSGCTHSHQPPTDTAHWAPGSCQAQERPPPKPDASPPAFPPAGAGSITNPIETPAFHSPECTWEMFDNNDYVVCYEARSPTVASEHHNLWRDEELIQGNWVIVSWSISSCGLGQGETSNCGHTPRPATLTRRQIWHSHADSQTWERLWVRVQRDCVPQSGEHSHGPTICEPNHPPVPDCVIGLPDDQTQTFATHDANGNNTTVQVPGCDPTETECVPQPGEHKHGAECERNHPPVPDCVLGLPDDQTQTFATHDANGNNTTVQVPGCDPTETECVPQLGEHKHGSVCERNHPPVPNCVLGLSDDQTRTYATHDANGNNTTVTVPGCDPTDCVPQPGQHAHGPVCERDHPPVPICVSGLPDSQTRTFATHDANGNNTTFEVPGCEPTDCVPQPGQHAHGPVCERNHPPVPICVPGLPDTQSAQYITHNAAGQNTTVTVPGCVPTNNQCVPQPGEHRHGSVCERNHPPVPICVPGLPDTQSAQYITHNAAGQNTTVTVPGCVPTTIPPPPTEDPDPDKPVCDANWGAIQLAALLVRLRWESYLGAGDNPPTPEIPGGNVFAMVASDAQGGSRYPAWTWLAIGGSRLNRGTLDVYDLREGHECYWEAIGVRVELRELIPSGGGDSEMRTLAAQSTTGATDALATAISTWDSWTTSEQTQWAAAFAPAQRVSSVWCDDNDLPVMSPLGDRHPTEETRRAACRWEIPRKGIWEWTLMAHYRSDQGDQAIVELDNDVSWFRTAVDLSQDRVTIW